MFGVWLVQVWAGQGITQFTVVLYVPALPPFEVRIWLKDR